MDCGVVEDGAWIGDGCWVWGLLAYGLPWLFAFEGEAVWRFWANWWLAGEAMDWLKGADE